MFQVPGYPCHRGDTTFNNGTFVNNGDSNCTLEASLSGASMNAYIEVPKHVEGSLKSAGSDLQVEFAKGGRANLHFAAPTSASEDDEKDAADFNKDWGGDIHAISSDGHYAVFSIGSSSCARVKLP
jgi:hypothetical protein